MRKVLNFGRKRHPKPTRPGPPSSQTLLYSRFARGCRANGSFRTPSGFRDKMNLFHDDVVSRFWKYQNERLFFYSVIKFSKHAHCPYTYGLFFPWALFTSSHINIISVGIISVGIISVLSHVVLTFWSFDLLFSKRNIWHWDRNSFVAVKWP